MPSNDPITLQTKEDVTNNVLEAAERTEEWFSSDAQIDWERFWDKLEVEGYFLANETSPAAAAIQKHIRELRKS